MKEHWSTLKKLIWLYATKLKGGASAIIETITGTLPLVLQNALSHAIVSLTRYGLCTQDGTPTPDAPVDILCNNGAIKVSPNLANMVSDNIVVGKYINNNGVETADTANFFYAPYIPVTPGGTYTMAMSQSIWYFSVMQYDSSQTFLRRTIWGATNTPVGTEKSFSVGSDCAYIRFGSNMRKATITESDVLAVNWMLTQTATAQEFRPYGEIYAGGTHPGQNLVDLTAVTDDYYYDPSGVYTAVSNARLTDFIPVKAGQEYTVYVKSATSGTAANVRCNLFDTAKTWKSQSSFTVNSGAEAVSVITPAEDGYLRVSANYTGAGAKVDWSTLQVVRGEYTLATMPPYEPYEEIPYLPEVLMVSGINLLDPSESNITIGEYVSAGGSTYAGVNNWRTDFIPVEGGKTYAFWGRKKEGNTISAYNRINWYTANKVQISPRPTILQDIVTVGTAPSNAAYAMLSCAPINSSNPITRDTFDEYNWMFAEASAEVPYQPYVTPQTASVPMLLGIGDYKDAAELINGIKTGKVGVKVLDGTGTWVKGGTQNQFYSDDVFTDRLIAGRYGFCTHFTFTTTVSDLANVGYVLFGASTQRINVSSVGFTDVAEWKAWLAAQYAAGTPVIMLYALETETTEQGTAQHLSTHEGTNIVDSVANVGPVEAKVEYYASESTTPPLLGMMRTTEPQDEPEAAEESSEPEESEESEEI